MNMKLPNFVNIIPVKDKKPLVAWKEYTEREQTQQEKDKLFLQYPNVDKGIVTGKVSKLLVLDNDGGLNYELYNVPKTWTAKTPRGGKHHYFKWTSALDGKVTTGVEILPKVDIRGDGGYVVFYGFESPYFTTPLALPPQWLIDLLPNKQTVEKSKLQGLLENVKEGNRNDSFTRTAGSLRARGYNSQEIFALLKAKAQETEFNLSELETICKSVERYTPKIQADTQASSIEEFLKEQESVDWICEGLIAKRSIGFVAGLPETGKTWMLIDLAVECAKGGGMWLNKFPVKKAKVLFIDQERFKGETQRRFRSVISAQKVSPASLKDQLLIRCGTSTRLNLQNSFDAFRKEVAEIRPDLIIVDSFVTFHTCEENNRTDIQKVLERVKELRNEFGCSFLFIHHESKIAFNKEDSGEPSISQMAGSIAIPAAAELVLTVRRQDSESSMVYNTKNTLNSTVSPFMVKVTDQNEEKTKIKVEAY